MAGLLLGTAERHIADVAVQNLWRRLMCLAGEVSGQLGLELKMKLTLDTIKLVAMRPLMMVLRVAVLLVFLRRIALMRTRLTIELFEFRLSFGLDGLTANASGQTGLLYAMLAGSRQAVERLPADTCAVRREATATGSGLGEVERHTEQVVAREAEPAVVAPATEETFRVVHDVGEEEHAPVDVDESRHPKVAVAMITIGQDDRVRLGLHPRAIGIDVRGGVGGVHFLQGQMIYCSFLCLNPSLPPYQSRSASSPLHCVS
jgi:hypothetical protein